jgi:CHASE2 domain-containing sensor protein
MMLAFAIVSTCFLGLAIAADLADFLVKAIRDRRFDIKVEVPMYVFCIIAIWALYSGTL